MVVRVDPEAHEIDALFELVDVRDREILEIGCGDGRLTWRYAGRTAHVTAIDPFADSIQRAKELRPDTLIDRVDLRPVAFEDFADVAEGGAGFDVAILSWSLC